MAIRYTLYLLLGMLKFMLFSYFTKTDLSLHLTLMNLVGMLILSSWTLLIPWNKRRWVWLGLLLAHSFLLASDMWYYRYFEDFLSVSLLSQMTQMSDVSSGFTALIVPQDFLLFADSLIFMVLLFVFRKRPEVATAQTRRRTAGLLAVSGIILSASLLTYRTLTEDRQPTAAISDMRDYYLFGFWGYHGWDAFKGVTGRPSDGLTAQEQQRINQKEQTNPTGAKKTPNIILVQLESFQASVIDQTINGEEVTPNLNQLKKESLYFSSFYHQTHEGRTSDAEFITNTSLYPLKSGSVYTQYPTNEFEPLPALLEKNGYDTAAMHAYEKGFWNRDDVYKNIGFKHFFSQKDYSKEKKIGMALNDQQFFLESIDHMETLQEPFFSFLVALTSHTPYEIDKEDQTLDLSGYEDPMLKRYYQTVHYVDTGVGKMIDELKQRNLWDQSLVIFYGDHDSGLVNEGSEMRKKADVSSPVAAFELERRIPLFIKKPDQQTGRVMKENGGQIDIAPTIIDLLNLKTSYMMGQSLIDDKPNLTGFRDGSFRYKDYYYEADLTKASGEGTCYDVSTEKKIEMKFCRNQGKDVSKQLKLSDKIIEENELE
ncbi:LTA synthase family protein [Exiguobacterium sp.]|uniref:LTA synthase family protein n=1 Tax=Exiguobacterium sp. TaxID=44751 RepID=UPI000E99D11F|nr:LTA synthase family protein [Exiguobacterium sp.]HBF59675.1 LTA synthase family protein [Exiguobacterium sp.]